MLLDTILPDNLGRSSYLFTKPRDVVQADDSQSVVRALHEVDLHIEAGRWIAGYVSFEAGYAFEPSLKTPPHTTPLVWFGVYDRPSELPAQELAKLLDSSLLGSFRLSSPELGVTKSTYLSTVDRIRRYIRDGDVYQINYTAPLTIDFDGDVLALYASLRRRQPVPYAAFIQTDGRTFLSLSPELFFLRNGRRIVTRPMKGTAPATGTDADDDVAETLRNDPKNRAENLMIVDLLRNDLSMCCSPGSVVVSELFGVQRYPTVLQMTSTVEGRLLTETGYSQIFRALFPSGSVTGAPKIRAMELIGGLESVPRDIYCGAVGFMAPNGRSTFNVAIRTVAIEGSSARMGTGSGIVWDSVAEDEYRECLLKTRFLADAVAQ